MHQLLIIVPSLALGAIAAVLSHEAIAELANMFLALQFLL